MRRLAVTGATGFVGRHVVSAAAAAGWEVVGLVRSAARAAAVTQAGGRPVAVGAWDQDALARGLEGADAVVHLAQIGAERDGATYAAVNVGLTRELARAATRAGVPRAVYFSGLGVAHYGMSRRCTNPYFLSKIQAEAILLDSGFALTIFRPSYVLGPGDAFVSALGHDIAQGELEQVGDGSYRMQPIAVRDAAAVALQAVASDGPRHRVFDLVGPETVSCREFLLRLAATAKRLGRAGDFRIREIAVGAAESLAKGVGYRGMGADELDCLLCDETSDARPLEALLGRFLTPLDDALAAALRGAA